MAKERSIQQPSGEAQLEYFYLFSVLPTCSFFLILSWECELWATEDRTEVEVVEKELIFFIIYDFQLLNLIKCEEENCWFFRLLT